MRSKPVSQSSPETGDDREEAREHAPKDAPGKGKGAAASKLSIELEVSRQRYAGWTIFGLVVGALLIWKLGTVGKGVGVVLMVLGALRAWQLLQTFLYPPGTIVIGDDEVVLPRGLCLPRPLRVPAKDVTAVYFLRRSVPWNRSAPVLVVELGPRAMAFPRDWFASEADQRHIVHALLRVRDGGSAAKPGKPGKAEPPASKAAEPTAGKAEPAAQAESTN